MFAGMQNAAREAYARAGMLYKLHLDLLYQCDLDCRHCYLDDKARRILPTAFWINVLDQAAALGVFEVTLSGGEIFLRKDLLELVAHARRLGLFVQLKTHGGHIERDTAEALAALGVSTVTLSYYAARAEVHDALTRRPGSHARTLAALEHLVAAGVLTAVNCVVMHENRHEWRAVLTQCEALGVFVLLSGELAPALSGDTFPKDLALGPDDLAALERHLITRAPDTDCDTTLDGSPSAAARATPTAWGDRKNCGAGHRSLYVSPEGEVTPCVLWPMPLGNLARGDRLADLWRAPTPALAEVRRQRQRERELCATCEVREHCDFCPGQSWVESGTPHTALRHFCTKTRARTLARAAALGLPEPSLPAGLLAAAAEAPPRFVVRAAPRP